MSECTYILVLQLRVGGCEVLVAVVALYSVYSDGKEANDKCQDQYISHYNLYYLTIIITIGIHCTKFL